MGGIYLHSLSIPPFESDSSALFYTSASLLPSPLRYSELLLLSTSAVRNSSHFAARLGVGRDISSSSEAHKFLYS